MSEIGCGLAKGDYNYQTGTHWLTRFGNATRHYSANGLTASSTAGGQTHLYEYIGHQLDWVTLDNGTWWGTTVSSYAYDAFGQRAEKRTYVPRYTDRRFAYNEAGQLIGDYDPHYDDGRPVPTYGLDYLWLDTLPIGVVDVGRSGSAVNYVIADGLDTPRIITDASGQTIWHWPVTGNPFGEQPPVSNAGYVYNLRFPGQYYDMETGFHYNMFRDYDRTTGRYVQSDPIGLRGGLSTYGYVNGNPLAYIDPYGLDSLMLGGSVSAIAIGGFTLSGGVYVSWGKDGFDTGFYGSAGMGIGVNIGVGVAGTYVPGSWKNISGTSLDGSVGYGPITFTGSASPTGDGCKKVVNGSGSVGVGLGLPAAGSLTTTKTGSVGWQDLMNFVRDHF